MENDHGSEPMSIEEILDSADDLVGSVDDPERAHKAAEVFAGYEVDVLNDERAAIISSIEEDPVNNDTPEARARLEQITRALLSAQADKTDIVRRDPGVGPGE
jgi:hypothetical protein